VGAGLRLFGRASIGGLTRRRRREIGRQALARIQHISLGLVGSHLSVAVRFYWTIYINMTFQYASIGRYRFSANQPSHFISSSMDDPEMLFRESLLAIGTTQSMAALPLEVFAALGFIFAKEYQAKRNRESNAKAQDARESSARFPNIQRLVPEKIIVPAELQWKDRSLCAPFIFQYSLSNLCASLAPFILQYYLSNLSALSSFRWVSSGRSLVGFRFATYAKAIQAS
jgi:hypothetical protein